MQSIYRKILLERKGLYLFESVHRALIPFKSSVKVVWVTADQGLTGEPIDKNQLKGLV